MYTGVCTRAYQCRVVCTKTYLCTVVYQGLSVHRCAYQNIPECSCVPQLTCVYHSWLTKICILELTYTDVCTRFYLETGVWTRIQLPTGVCAVAYMWQGCKLVLTCIQMWVPELPEITSPVFSRLHTIYSQSTENPEQCNVLKHMLCFVDNKTNFCDTNLTSCI